MKIANINGIQHIGLPARDLEATIRFYEGLGFEVAHRTATPDGIPVAFMQLGSCVIESWQEANPVGRAGAIDHIALDVTNIDQVCADVQKAGYAITTNGIESLPFWEKGVRFFKIQGPDAESIEFCEILK